MWDPSLLPPSLSDLTLVTSSLSLHSHRALLIPHLPALAALLCPACPPHEPVTIILDPDFTSDINLTDALNTLYTTGDASFLALEMGLLESPERKQQQAEEEVSEETPEAFKQEEIQNQPEAGKECTNCNLTFALESSLKKHMKSCVLGISPRWECSVCAERFQFRRMLTSHRKDKHTGKPVPKTKSKLEISIGSVKSEESVGDFLFVEGNIAQPGHEELKEYVDDTFDLHENPSEEERDIELPLMEDSVEESTTEEEFVVEIAESKVAGIVQSGTEEESDVGRFEQLPDVTTLPDARSQLPDVTTLLEKWRTKMLKGE